VTPIIIRNIVELSEQRRGVLIFTASVRHAEEILEYLPRKQSALVIGDTPGADRDAIVERFKRQELKFLVNVSVLTTGFDAPHTDVIAILRPTESVSLYQQIVGRGLRLAPGKDDCLVLDYTGVPHDIFRPQIDEKKPTEDSVPVRVPCPRCRHTNEFWGIVDGAGNILEHFGRKCRGAVEAADGDEILPCGFRYRFKNCDRCGDENDIAARTCESCGHPLIDDDVKLQRAMTLKDAHVMRPETMIFTKRVDKEGRERLEVRYYDPDSQFLSEVFYLNNANEAKVFFYNFIRMHNRRPETSLEVASVDEAIRLQGRFRLPMFIIARKQGEYWKIREKIFR
jgi:DNA repair protein RadD